MEQRAEEIESIIQKLNKDEKVNKLDVVNQLLELLSQNQTAATLLNVDDLNTILSLLETEVDEVKDRILKCVETISNKSTEQILVDSKMSNIFENIILSSDDRYVARIVGIYKNLFNYKPPSPIKNGTLITDFDNYEYIMLKNNENSEKVKAKLSRLVLPFIERQLDSDDKILINRGYLLLQSYYNTVFSKKANYLFMYGIDKRIKDLIDKIDCISSEMIDYLQKILSDIDIYTLYKEDCDEGTIDKLLQDLEKDLSYDNCVSMEENYGIISNLCSVIKWKVYEEYFNLLDYMLFIGEEKRVRDNLEVNPFIQDFIYNGGDLIVDQYQYEYKICKSIIYSYLPYNYDHFSEGYYSGVQYLVDKDKTRRMIKRKVNDNEKNRIKKIRIGKSNISKIETYIQSVKILNSFYTVESVASVFIKEINNNEIVIKEYEFKMNLDEMKEKNGLKNMFYKIVLGILLGLECIHECNLIHSDVNLNNIFIEDDDSVYIDDQFKNTIRDVSDIPISSIKFLSPEYLSSNEITQESDVFSLGIVMNYILNGVKLFDGNSLQSITTTIINSENVVVEAENKELEKLINRMKSKKKEERPVIKEVRLVIEREYSLDDEDVMYDVDRVNDYLLELLISNNILLPDVDYYARRCAILIIDKYNETKLLCYYPTLLNIKSQLYFKGGYLRLHFLEETEGDEEEAGMKMDELAYKSSYKNEMDLEGVLYDENQKLIDLASFFPYIPQLKKLNLCSNDRIQFKYVKAIIDGLSYLTNLEKLELEYNELSNKTVKYIRNFDENIRPLILPRLEISYDKKGEIPDDDEEEDDDEENEEE